MSSWTWPAWSSSKELKKEEEKKHHVYRGEIIDDENEAESVWKSILKRKGLPMDTKYKYVDTFDKGYDESYCDMLYLTIEEKKKNPEAAKSWGKSTFDWLHPPASPTDILSVTRKLPLKRKKKKKRIQKPLTYDLYFDDRKRGKKFTRDVNGIIYPKGSEASKKRCQLSADTTKKNMELYPPIACRFCP